MAAMAKKSGFTQMIDDTLIHTIDDDLVINVGTIKALSPLMSQGIIERDQLQIIITVLDVWFDFYNLYLIATVFIFKSPKKRI
jgi:hypothetical protein